MSRRLPGRDIGVSAGSAAYQQTFEERAKKVRAQVGREPLYVEYIPVAVNWNPELRVPLDRIGYLLGSHAPDIISRVAMAERDARGLLGQIERRAVLHVEFQRRATEVERAAKKKPAFGELEIAVGRDLTVQLRQLTEILIGRLPACCALLKAVGDQLGEVLAFQFPLSRPIRFVEETKIAREANPTLPKAALWRRILRLANRPLPWK